jgi:hypothetical protein
MNPHEDALRNWFCKGEDTDWFWIDAPYRENGDVFELILEGIKEYEKIKDKYEPNIPI